MHAERHVAKRRITAEQLITSQSGNRHLEPQLARGFADEPGVEPVDCRLVHRIENFGQIVSKLSLRYQTRSMPRAILPRDFRGDWGFIILRAAKFFESQGHRLDISLTH